MKVAPSGRLQRPPDFTGNQLTTFRQVVTRHGLPGLVLAIACLAVPGMLSALNLVLQPGISHSGTYLTATVVIFLGLLIFSAARDGELKRQQMLWVVYLGLLSLWEEWVFRVALPQIQISMGVSFVLAIIISNLLFGAMHYFTLRWRWQWCLGAIIGGLALSRHIHTHEDLLILTALHWLGTFINTPRPPAGRA